MQILNKQTKFHMHTSKKMQNILHGSLQFKRANLVGQSDNDIIVCLYPYAVHFIQSFPIHLGYSRPFLLNTTIKHYSNISTLCLANILHLLAAEKYKLLHPLHLSPFHRTALSYLDFQSGITQLSSMPASANSLFFVAFV